MPQPRTMKSLEKTMRDQGVPDDIIAQFNFPQATTGDKVIALVNQMDTLLTKEQCLSVMGEHGCFKTGFMDAKSKSFGKENAGKSLAEKLETAKAANFRKNIPYINDAGELIYEMRCYHDGDRERMLSVKNCACPPIYNSKQPLSVSHIFCGCCAGHHKHHWQNALGIKLRLKSIETSPRRTDMGYPRVFIFEIDD